MFGLLTFYLYLLEYARPDVVSLPVLSAQSRLRQIRITRFSLPVWLVTESFVGSNSALS